MFNVLTDVRVVYLFIISYCMQVIFLLDLNAHILPYSHIVL